MAKLCKIFSAWIRFLQHKLLNNISVPILYKIMFLLINKSWHSNFCILSSSLVTFGEWWQLALQNMLTETRFMFDYYRVVPCHNSFLCLKSFSPELSLKKMTLSCEPRNNSSPFCSVLAPHGRYYVATLREIHKKSIWKKNHNSEQRRPTICEWFKFCYSKTFNLPNPC